MDLNDESRWVNTHKNIFRLLKILWYLGLYYKRKIFQKASSFKYQIKYSYQTFKLVKIITFNLKFYLTTLVVRIFGFKIEKVALDSGYATLDIKKYIIETILLMM